MHTSCCLARRPLILRGIDRNTGELFDQFIYQYVANFAAISRASPCQASMTGALSPTTSASPPRRAAPTNKAGQTSSVPQTGECWLQRPLGDKGCQPLSMSQRCFQTSNWFPLMTVLCKWLLLGLFITGGNFSVSSLCHKILDIFPPDDF